MEIEKERMVRIKRKTNFKMMGLTLLLICLSVACNFRSVKEVNSQLDETVCDCIKSVTEKASYEEQLNANLICIRERAKNNRDTFIYILNQTFNHCDGFARKISELNLSISDLDTIDFRSPEISDCAFSSGEIWKDILADTTDYSIHYDDRVEHYSNSKVTSVWTILSRNNCKTTYVVTREEKDQAILPNVGDTIVSTTIGIKDNMVKTILEIRNFEIVSVGIKLE